MYSAQHLADSLFVTQNLIGSGVSNQENEAVRHYWRRALNPAEVLDQISDKSGSQRRKVKTIRFEFIIVQFEQRRVVWLSPCDKHHLERLL